MAAAGIAAAGPAQAGGYHRPTPGVYAVDAGPLVILLGPGQRYTTDTRHWDHYFTPLDRPHRFGYAPGHRPVDGRHLR